MTGIPATGPSAGALLAAIAGGLEDAVLVVDPADAVVMINDAAVRLLGVATDAVQGQNLASFLPASLVEPIRQTNAVVRQSRAPVAADQPVFDGRGNVRLMRARFVPVAEGAGAVTAVAILLREAAAGEESVRRAHEANLIYRRVIENLPDCLNVKDREGRFLVANEATAGLMIAGSASELIGKTDFDFYPHDVAEHFRQDEQRILEDGLPQLIEQEAIRRDGTHVHLSTLKVPFRNEADVVTGLITHNRDITEQKLLEKQLAESRQRFNDALAGLSDGLAVFDGAGKLVFCNKQYSEMFPRSADVCVTGRSVRDILMAAAERGDFREPPGVLAAVDGQPPSAILRALEEGAYQLTDGRWIETRAKFADSGDCLLINVDATQRRRAAKALEESEERYRRIAEITQEAWWEENPRTGDVTNSLRLCEMLGLEERTLAFPLADYLARIHPDDHDRVEATFQRAMRERTDYIETYRVRHAAGHYIWVEDRARVIACNADGEPTRVLGSLTDITARKTAELSLRESEERYRQVAEITQETWWEEDLTRSIVKNSRRFCDMLGHSEEMLECTVEDYAALIHPDDSARARADFARAVQEGVDHRMVYRIRHADGHYVWVEDRGRIMIRDQSGRPIRALGSLTDITERREVELALQASEEKFRRMFDEAPDAIITVDIETGAITACNEAATRMLRGSREQIIGLSPARISPPFQPDGTPSDSGTRERIALILKNGYHRFEWVHRRLDGSDFWAEVTVTVGREGNRRVMYGSWREIGEIIAAKQAAEAANIAKSQFLSVVSHELRTPLNAIMGMFQLIQFSGVNDKARDFAARGLKSSEHLLSLVEEILDFSSIEAGRLTAARVPFALGPLLDEVSSLRAGKRAQPIDLTVTLDASLEGLEFIGDPQRLKQVLINLLGNALKFTERGNVVLSVTRVGGTQETPQLEFAVADTGIGLTTDQKSRLFQPFTQVDMSNARRFGGAGLGLVISQRLVGLMGGEPIKVDSEPGIGSRFSFRMALPVSSAAAGKGVPKSPPAASAPAGRLSGLKLLLVEDSETARFALRLLLEAEGAKVSEARDGAEGVSMALGAPSPFDTVLMDMQMPVKDGLEATRELRAQGYATPIVALTANAFERDRTACLAAGMNDYLAKPVKTDDLVRILQRNTAG